MPDRAELETQVFDPIYPDRCWAVVHKNRGLALSARHHETCYFRARSGTLTCRIHAHLEDKAQALNAINCKEMGIECP